jgi:general stress protein 26
LPPAHPCLPARHAAVSPSQTTLYFLANNVTGKFDDIEADPQVNVSFYDTASTSWVSYDAKALVTQDRAKIKAHWNRAQHPGYFGDVRSARAPSFPGSRAD